MNSGGLTFLGFAFLGYLAGSLPFAVWISKLVTGQDVRAAGSGHATATNTIRQAGWLAGSAVLVMDLLKGFLVVYIGDQIGGDWTAILAAVGAVAGHCWPLFAGFRGGMGLAVTAGALLAVSPLSLGLGMAVLVALVLLVRHAARATILTALVVPPLFWWLRLPFAAFGIATAAGIVMILRFLGDWNRQYRELWLDREQGETKKTSRLS